jgi:hypothetical protein
MKTETIETEIKKGCGEDYCGKFIFYKDKIEEETLCPSCKSKLEGLRLGVKSCEEEQKEKVEDLKDRIIINGNQNCGVIEIIDEIFNSKEEPKNAGVRK